jgi:alpha-acetolactate decarboxylase
MIVRLPNGAMRSIDPQEIVATTWADDGSLIVMTLTTADGEKIELHGQAAQAALEEQRASWQEKDAPPE